MEPKNSGFPTEWLNLLRFLAVFFIVWSHFDNRIYEEIFPFQVRVQKQFSFPLSAWLRMIYGYTGKYAVTMLCVVSGFVTSWVCRHKNTGSFWQFLVKRYLRLLLPVSGISAAVLLICLLTEMKSYTIYEIISGLFFLGSESFSDYYWCLPAFFAGNVLIWLLNRWEEKTEIAPVLKTGILFVCMAGSFVLAYKIYSSRLFWITSVLSGFFIYEFYIQIDMPLPEYVIILLMGVVCWLPVGAESMKIYMRDTLASCIVIYIMLHMDQCLEEISRFCSRKKVAELLKYSYSLFVVHGFTMKLFLDHVVFWVYGWTGHWWMMYVLVFALKFACDLCLAAAVHYLFEDRAYRMCCRLIDGKS